tara:strand:+ start:204 stop:704 length:501 start_codon:yes stop_codon:yes gene_type:complete
MIQRLQTIFLLLTSVFYFSYWLFGLEWYEKGYPVILDIFNGSEYINTILISISYIPLIISGISFVSIFIFKNRKLQIKLTQLSFRLSLVMSLFTIFYFYNCLSYLTDEICREINITVFTRSGFSFIIFHGSSSAKYLFPILAIFMNSEHASLNLKLLSDSSTLLID